VSYIPTTCTTF
jgi:hypothetical protein